MNIPAHCFNPTRLLNQSELNKQYQFIAKILGLGKDTNNKYAVWVELYERKTGEPKHVFFTIDEFHSNFAPLAPNNPS